MTGPAGPASARAARDSATLAVALGMISDCAREEIRPFRSALQSAIDPHIDALWDRFDGDAWNLGVLYSIVAALKFLDRKRELAALPPRPHDGSGACILCLGARPTQSCHAGPSACAAGMHRRCWIEWKLDGRSGSCPVCRGAC